jgi:hypothetical protein
MKRRIYIDTSVIGGCFDEEFSTWSNQLMDEFISGDKIMVLSDITLRELELAPERVRNRIEEIPESNTEFILTEEESETLASLYISEGAITDKFYEDALHIANATLQMVHVLASWNFKHIVNLERIKKYNGVNMKNGYPVIEIRTPREILKAEDNEK